MPTPPSEDPFEGFDAGFNPFNLPDKKSADMDFAANPGDFQTAAQKKPKEYLDLAKYMSLDEEEKAEGSDGEESNQETTSRTDPLNPHARETRAGEKNKNTEDDINSEPVIKDVGYGNNWREEKKREPESKIAKPQFERQGKKSKEDHEQDMLDALGGDLVPEEEDGKTKLKRHN